MSYWRQIETCPNDTLVLLWYEGFYVGRWDKDEWVDKDGLPIKVWKNSEHVSMKITIDPTHWQELPNVPNDDDD